jgi:hypothetical protein
MQCSENVRKMLSGCCDTHFMKVFQTFPNNAMLGNVCHNVTLGNVCHVAILLYVAI